MEGHRGEGFPERQGKPWYLHPDDRERVTKALERAHADRKEFRIEYRVKLRGGGLRHMESRGRFLYDAEGQADRAIGSSIDVSERVRLIRASASSPPSPRQQWANDWSRGGELLASVNPAGRRMLGRRTIRTRTPGSHWSRIGPVRIDPASRPRGEEGSWRGEVRFMNQVTGDPIPCECSTFAIRDLEGELQHIALIAQNVSERKRSQALLEDRVSQLLALRNIEIAISGASRILQLPRPQWGFATSSPLRGSSQLPYSSTIPTFRRSRWLPLPDSSRVRTVSITAVPIWPWPNVRSMSEGG